MKLEIEMLKLPTLSRWFLILGALNMAFTVGLGAAAAHGLKALLAANDPGGWFQMALHYHQIHSLGVLATGATLLRVPANRWLIGAGLLLLGGMVLFSGNLYLRSIASIHFFHAVLPLGGMAYIAGWLCYAIGLLKSE